jgi:FkbM family methyltransferase
MNLTSEMKRKVNKQSILTSLVQIMAVLGRLRLVRILYKVLFGKKVLSYITGNRFLYNIPFSFNAEVDGTRFQLRGPFRYAGGYYYITYLRQGAWEAAVTSHITQVVRNCPIPRILDVGAHYGWYTLYLAKLAADKGIVYSFEPSEETFACLKQNVEVNDLHNVHLYNLPLSDKRETIRMIVSKRFPREARYMSVIEPSTPDNYDGLLGAIPFDEINEAEAIHPNIVKIDVRGSWRKVVDGMRKSLYRDVEHLYLEVDATSKNLSTQHEDIKHVISILYEAGMDVYEIQDFTRREGGRMIKANEDLIANKFSAMLYGIKRG